jgi:hypothetical protein
VRSLSRCRTHSGRSLLHHFCVDIVKNESRQQIKHT